MTCAMGLFSVNDPAKSFAVCMEGGTCKRGGILVSLIRRRRHSKIEDALSHLHSIVVKYNHRGLLFVQSMNDAFELLLEDFKRFDAFLNLLVDDFARSRSFGHHHGVWFHLSVLVL